MSKLASDPQAVKSNFRNHRIHYPFTPVPDSMLERLDHPTAERLYRALCACIRQGWTDPPVRYLAAQIRRSYMQTMRGLKILEKAGYLRRIRRRISRTRCATNVYELTGFSRTNVTEKKNRDLKRTAPPPARRIVNHFPAMRKLYDHNAVLIAQLRGLRAILRSDRRSEPHQVRSLPGPCRIPQDEIERLYRKLK